MPEDGLERHPAPVHLAPTNIQVQPWSVYLARLKPLHPPPRPYSELFTGGTLLSNSGSNEKLTSKRSLEQDLKNIGQ